LAGEKRLCRRGRNSRAMSIVEDGSFIESGALVSHSIVGPNTFVGKLAELSESFALGDTLVN